MKAVYKGKLDELTPAQQRKIEAKFSKLGKLLDRKGEREAHVILTTERHLHHAEITVRYKDHALVGIGSGADQFLAVSAAIEKLEKQAVKLSSKWRDNKRGPKQEWEEGEAAPQPGAAEAVPAKPGPLVFRTNEHERRKPMTAEEALLEIGKDRDYLVYRDAVTDRVSVLLRRRDGNFDLIEG